MLESEIKELTDRYYKQVVDLRHQFHKFPETGFEEYNTSKTIAEELKKLGIEVQTNIANTGVIGLIRGKNPGKTVLLRADMDALNINEETDLPYKSQIPGKMHACGHDGHTAGLIGCAMVLNELKDYIKGNIKLMFQPAEETVGGANPMILEGILENPKVDAAFGCHLWGGVAEGKIDLRHGPTMASPDTFIFKIIGKGGHGALPHLSVDPIVIASQVINNMQTIISRRVDPLKAAVISFCSIHGGENHNVIPNEVIVSGTIRTFDKDLRAWIPKTMEKMIKGIVESNDGDYTFEYIERFPILINDKDMTDLALKSISKVIGSENVRETPDPIMGGEDFSYIAEKVPSSFYFVGISKDIDKQVIHHHPKFQWDDKNLITIMNTMSQIAVDFLND